MYDTNLGGEVRLDQDLYVSRQAEQAVCGILNRQAHTANLVLLVGEAGFGKTSLLWHLYDSLNRQAGWEPWFIKSTILLSPTTAEPLQGTGQAPKRNVAVLADAAKALV